MSVLRRVALRLRGPLGCLGAAVVTLVTAVVASSIWLDPDVPLSTALLESPALSWLDPSDGETDVQLADALAGALLVPPFEDSHYVQVEGEPRDGMGEPAFTDPADFEARLQTVGGWDVIVTLLPYSGGARASRHPAITSSWLRRRLARMSGPQDDEHCEVLAVREGAIVATICFSYPEYGGSPDDWQDVIVRRD